MHVVFLLFAHECKADGDLAHQCRDVPAGSRILCPANDIDQYGPDEPSGCQGLLDLSGPVGQAPGVGRSIEQVIVDALDKVGDQTGAGPERTGQERIECLGLAADANGACDVGEQQGWSLGRQAIIELIDPESEPGCIGGAVEEGDVCCGDLFFGRQRQKVRSRCDANVDWRYVDQGFCNVADARAIDDAVLEPVDAGESGVRRIEKAAICCELQRAVTGTGDQCSRDKPADVVVQQQVAGGAGDQGATLDQHIGVIHRVCGLDDIAHGDRHRPYSGRQPVTRLDDNVVDIVGPRV